MFCSNCGNKLADDAIFCPHCGRKVIRNTSAGIPSVSIDLQGLKNKTATVASNLGNLASTGGSQLRNLDAKKCLYGLVISLVLIILFGSMVNHSLHPVKRVNGKITYAGSVYTNDSKSTNIWERDYYQYVEIEYKGEEWSGDVKVMREGSGYSYGDSIPVYIVNGHLTRDKHSGEVNVIAVMFSTILLLISIGSCGWFGLQYSKKRRG